MGAFALRQGRRGQSRGRRTKEHELSISDQIFHVRGLDSQPGMTLVKKKQEQIFMPTQYSSHNVILNSIISVVVVRGVMLLAL